MGVAGSEARVSHLSPPAGRGRIASAIQVRGSFRKGGSDCLKNAGQIARDVIIPKAQDAVIAIGEPFIPNGVALAVSMLATVDFHDQAPVATDEVDRVGSDRLLSNEFVSIEPSSAKAIPKRPLRIRQVAAQSSRPPGLDFISTAHADAPPHPSRSRRARRPLPASGGEAKIARKR